ncbi:hypothetical protein WH47_02104, partial [Habropoda laboriosa]
DERRRTGRYVAGGAVLAIMLLAVHHALLRDASTITGVFIPAIIMVSYIVWILYSAHRDRRKALRVATMMPLTEVISVPEDTKGAISSSSSSSSKKKKKRSNKKDQRKSDSEKLTYAATQSRENPAFNSKDEAP